MPEGSDIINQKIKSKDEGYSKGIEQRTKGGPKHGIQEIVVGNLQDSFPAPGIDFVYHPGQDDEETDGCSQSDIGNTFPLNVIETPDLMQELAIVYPKRQKNAFGRCFINQKPIRFGRFIG